jgi:hypothetical protein
MTLVSVLIGHPPFGFVILLGVPRISMLRVASDLGPLTPRLSVSFLTRPL